MGFCVRKWGGISLNCYPLPGKEKLDPRILKGGNT